MVLREFDGKTKPKDWTKPRVMLGPLKRYQVNNAEVVHNNRWNTKANNIAAALVCWNSYKESCGCEFRENPRRVKMMLAALREELLESGVVSELEMKFAGPEPSELNFLFEQVQQNWRDIARHHDNISGEVSPPELVCAR